MCKSILILSEAGLNPTRSILGNYKNNNDTETTTANKSMGFDPSAIQSCHDINHYTV